MGWHKNQIVSLRRTSDGSHWIYTKAQFSVGFETKIKLKVNVNQAQHNRNLNSAKMHFGQSLDILTSVEEELWREQTQNRVNFSLALLELSKVKFDLESQGQLPHKTLVILTKVLYTCDPNLMILAWTGDELSCGQARWHTEGRTDGHTDRRRQRQYPEAKTSLG